MQSHQTYCLSMMRIVMPGAVIATGGPHVDLRRRSCAPSRHHVARREPTRHAEGQLRKSAHTQGHGAGSKWLVFLKAHPWDTMAQC